MSEDVDGEAWARQFSLKECAGARRLTDGEAKMCRILKVTPEGLKAIKREVVGRVRAHGLLKKGRARNQLHIEIGDAQNVEASMTTRIGLVDPQTLPPL